MVDSLAGFIKALDRVPDVLLSRDDARVLSDARTSAGVLENIEHSPVAVVLVGSTGVGKSHLVNDLVGMVASEVGVLRPTTTALVAAGSSGPAKVNYAGEYVFAPAVPDGMAIVDTPAPETDAAAVGASLAAADVGILVVSPSRYADAATHDLWSAMERIPRRFVVLNRLRGPQAERSEVLASAAGRFPDTTVLEVEEGGGADGVRDLIIQQVLEQPSKNEEASIARTAATEAGRHVARALTASAMDLGALAEAVDGVVLPKISGKGLAVLESWLATEQELVALVRRSIDDLDRSIVDSARGALAERLAASLGPWESGNLEQGITDWRDATADVFRSNATIRWRRSSTEQLLDHASWKVGVNPTVRVTKRARRAMGSRLDPVTSQVNASLISMLNDAIDERRAHWRESAELAGSFKPGELLAAVEALEAK